MQHERQPSEENLIASTQEVVKGIKTEYRESFQAFELTAPEQREEYYHSLPKQHEYEEITSFVDWENKPRSRQDPIFIKGDECQLIQDARAEALSRMEQEHLEHSEEIDALLHQEAKAGDHYTFVAFNGSDFLNGKLVLRATENTKKYVALRESLRLCKGHIEEVGEDALIITVPGVFILEDLLRSLNEDGEGNGGIGFTVFKD